MRRRQLINLINEIVSGLQLDLHDLQLDLDEIKRLAEQLRVPARRDCIANFIAAYMVVKGLMPPSLADSIASSSKGRRHWQKKLADLLQSQTHEP